MSIGSRIKELRMKHGYTQDQIAEKLGMNRANFSNYERDVATPPGETLVKIAEILRTSTDHLLGKETDMEHVLDVATTVNERDFLILARHAEEIPKEERENVKKFIADTIESYLKRIKDK